MTRDGAPQATRHLKSDRVAYLKCRSKFVAFVFVQGLDPKQPKNWTKVRDV